MFVYGLLLGFLIVCILLLILLFLYKVYHKFYSKKRKGDIGIKSGKWVPFLHCIQIVIIIEIVSSIFIFQFQSVSKENEGLEKLLIEYENYEGITRKQIEGNYEELKNIIEGCELYIEENQEIVGNPDNQEIRSEVSELRTQIDTIQEEIEDFEEKIDEINENSDDTKKIIETMKNESESQMLIDGIGMIVIPVVIVLLEIFANEIREKIITGNNNQTEKK